MCLHIYVYAYVYVYAQDCIREQQIVGFTGLTITIVFTNRKGDLLGTALPGFRSCNPPMAKAE